MNVDNHTRPESITREALARIQAVIFDVDGTLYDQRALRWRIVSLIVATHCTRPTHGVRVIRAIRAYRRAHEELRAQAFSADVQLARAAARCGYTVAEVRVIIDQWFERAPLALLPRCVYWGLPEFLHLLSELRISCGVFSDYPAEAKLSAMGLTRCFSHVRSATDVGRQKPDPLGILSVAHEMGVTPAETLCVGDRTIDVEAAAAAGMHGILVRGGNSCAILHDHFASRRGRRLP